MQDSPRMDDELREPVVAALESFARDLAVGEYGDPHVAFAVLVHADRPPTVVVLTGGDHVDLTQVSASISPADDDRKVPFTSSELREASAALDSASMGVACWRGPETHVGTMEMGEFIAHLTEQQWTRMRAFPIEQALAGAAFEASHPHQCAGCKRRFGTERGRAMHQSRSHNPLCRETVPAR